MDYEYRSIYVSGKDRPSKLSEHLKMLYNKPIQISEKNDLMKLCKSEAIPKEFHKCYQNILSSSKTKDTIQISDSETNLRSEY